MPVNLLSHSIFTQIWFPQLFWVKPNHITPHTPVHQHQNGPGCSFLKICTLHSQSCLPAVSCDFSEPGLTLRSPWYAFRPLCLGCTCTTGSVQTVRQGYIHNISKLLKMVCLALLTSSELASSRLFCSKDKVTLSDHKMPWGGDDTFSSILHKILLCFSGFRTYPFCQ